MTILSQPVEEALFDGRLLTLSRHRCECHLFTDAGNVPLPGDGDGDGDGDGGNGANHGDGQRRQRHCSLRNAQFPRVQRTTLLSSSSWSWSLHCSRCISLMHSSKPGSLAHVLAFVNQLDMTKKSMSISIPSDNPIPIPISQSLPEHAKSLNHLIRIIVSEASNLVVPLTTSSFSASYHQPHDVSERNNLLLHIISTSLSLFSFHRSDAVDDTLSICEAMIRMCIRSMTLFMSKVDSSRSQNTDRLPLLCIKLFLSLVPATALQNTIRDLEDAYDSAEYFERNNKSTDVDKTDVFFTMFCRVLVPLQPLDNPVFQWDHIIGMAKQKHIAAANSRDKYHH